MEKEYTIKLTEEEMVLVAYCLDFTKDSLEKCLEEAVGLNGFAKLRLNDDFYALGELKEKIEDMA